MIKYIDVKPSVYKDQYASLNEEHYKDDHRKTSAALDIDWDMYDVLYENKALISIAAYEEENLVGYINAIISPTPHNKGKTIAAMDALFVAESHRNKGIAKELMAKLEERCGEADVSWLHVMFRSSKVAEGVLGGMSYSKEQVTYVKSIGGNS